MDGPKLSLPFSTGMKMSVAMFFSSIGFGLENFRVIIDCHKKMFYST